MDDFVPLLIYLNFCFVPRSQPYGSTGKGDQRHHKELIASDASNYEASIDRHALSPRGSISSRESLSRNGGGLDGSVRSGSRAGSRAGSRVGSRAASRGAEAAVPLMAREAAMAAGGDSSTIGKPEFDLSSGLS